MVLGISESKLTNFPLMINKRVIGEYNEHVSILNTFQQ